MTSLNESVNLLHAAYCQATGFELPLLASFERSWFDAHKFGVSPDDVKLVVKARIRGITTGDRKPASIYLRNLIGDEDMLAEFAMELAAIKATMRKKVFSPGKREALESTGRPGKPESSPAKSTRDIILAMKEAAQ